jgi:hypothetical protein
MINDCAPHGEIFDIVGKSWSGKEDSNLRPLPPEECRPAKTGGFARLWPAPVTGTKRDSAPVAGTDTGTLFDLIGGPL